MRQKTFPGRPWTQNGLARPGKREFSGQASPSRRTRTCREIPRPWEKRSSVTSSSQSEPNGNANREIARWRKTVKVGEYVHFPRYNKLTETAVWTAGKVLKIQEPNDFNRSIFVHIECDDKFFTVQSMDDLLPAPPNLGGSPMFKRVNLERERLNASRQQMAPMEVPLPESDDEHDDDDAEAMSQDGSETETEPGTAHAQSSEHASRDTSGCATQLSSTHVSAAASRLSSTQLSSPHTSAIVSRLSSSATPSASHQVAPIAPPIHHSAGSTSRSPVSNSRGSTPAPCGSAGECSSPPPHSAGVVGHDVDDVKEWRTRLGLNDTVFLTICKSIDDPAPVWVEGTISKIEEPKESGSGSTVIFVHVVNKDTGLFTVASRSCVFPTCKAELLCRSPLVQCRGAAPSMETAASETVRDPIRMTEGWLERIMTEVFGKYAENGIMNADTMDNYIQMLYPAWSAQRRSDCIGHLLTDYGNGIHLDVRGFLTCYLSSWEEPEGRDMIRSELTTMGYALLEN